MKVKIELLELNTGQIKGVPKNPRFIRDDRYEQLKTSIQDDPEMLELRELIVKKVGEVYVVLGGNMRLRAVKELGHTEADVKVVPDHWPAKKLRAIAIKDNVAYGSDDTNALLDEWDLDELRHWGVDLGELEDDDENKEVTETDDLILKYIGEDGISMRASLEILTGAFDAVQAEAQIQKLVDDFGDYDEATQIKLILDGLAAGRRQ